MLALHTQPLLRVADAVKACSHSQNCNVVVVFKDSLKKVLKDSLKKKKKMSLLMLMSLKQMILLRPARKKPKLRPLTLLLPLMLRRPPRMKL